jgi:transmembrane sensor
MLTDETLFERLDVICEAVGATYKVVDAQVVVAGKNCN